MCVYSNFTTKLNGVGGVGRSFCAHAGSSTLSCVDTDNTLCCSPYCYPLLNAVIDLVIFAPDPGAFDSGDTQGASHARKHMNKQL